MILTQRHHLSDAFDADNSDSVVASKLHPPVKLRGPGAPAHTNGGTIGSVAVSFTSRLVFTDANKLHEKYFLGRTPFDSWDEDGRSCCAPVKSKPTSVCLGSCDSDRTLAARSGICDCLFDRGRRDRHTRSAACLGWLRCRRDHRIPHRLGVCGAAICAVQ